MSALSDCCGAETYSSRERELAWDENIRTEPICSKCHKPCEIKEPAKTYRIGD